MTRAQLFGICLLLAASGLSNCSTLPSAGKYNGQLGVSTGMYPRVIRTDVGGSEVVVASVTNFDEGAHADIFLTRDGGRSFSKAGEVRDPDFDTGLCCGGLYVLPQAVGALPAGTLLYAGSVGQDREQAPMHLKIYRSNDQGRSWAFLSACHTAQVSRKGGGLWEAELLVTQEGTLACLFSDETVSGHSQILQESLSADGLIWSSPRAVVALPEPVERPGMPVVSRLASGVFFMTYEICGPLHNCDVYSRTSHDGVDWGDPAEPGQMVVTEDGLTLRATPTNALARAQDGKSQLIVTGQRVYRSGVYQADFGATLFIDASGTGEGPLRAVAAPVEVLDIPADGNVCQNYSSALLPSRDGKSILMLASDYADGQCRTSSGSMALP